MDMDKLMRNFDISRTACEQHADRALRAFRCSPRIRDKGDRIVLPSFTSGWCVKIKMPIGERTLGVSFSIAADRFGNRAEYDEIGPGKPPSTMEILLMVSIGDFSDLGRQLGYDGDIRSFSWDSTPGAPEAGFSEVIDELIRLRSVLDGNLAASSPDHEETEVDDADDSDEDADDDDPDAVVEEAIAAVVEVKQARLDELEQIFLRGLELIRQLKAE